MKLNASQQHLRHQQDTYKPLRTISECENDFLDSPKGSKPFAATANFRRVLLTFAALLAATLGSAGVSTHVIR